MPLPTSARIRFLFLFSLFGLTLRGAEIGPFTGPEADAEAARLYERARDFVNNVTEGKYSYAYIQFYWKRSGANVDRILSAYPSSPTAKKIQAGELAVGPYAAPYFKQRVLPRLEEKKVASFDAINCSIFLYNLEQNQDLSGKRELLAAIIQTLCRQIRWSEALSFPVLDEDRPWLWNEVARQAAIYHNDKLVDELVKNMVETEQPRLLATVVEALAFRGEDTQAIEKFLTAHGNGIPLRVAAFRGFARRELQIVRALQQKRPLKGLYDGVDGIQKPSLRVNLLAFQATILPEDRSATDEAYGCYLAGIGNWKEARQLSHAPTVLASYLEYLLSNERYNEAVALASRSVGQAGGRLAFGQLIVALDLVGRASDASALRDLLSRQLGVPAVAYLEFRSRILSTDHQLVIREHSFAELPITDPNLLGRLVCEWSLTPNRTLRGAAPWDAIVFKFAPGFENLPDQKDKKKVEAAGR